MEIYFTNFDSPLGNIEIVASKHALQTLHFIEIKNVPSLHLPEIVLNCIQQLEEYFEGKRKIFSVNTEQKGTDFQKLVWKKLADIPYGKTVFYLEIAKKAGDEKSVRAVGNASGKNKIPIIIPCHRVIGTNDSLVGYSGGLWRKQWLLDHEKKYTYGIQKLF
ncbi:MAG TPA: methylated-DNA--[protein]-cysteine S-methyltransferase [Bacteroidia bacterium]|nr:methylated-DNA--[protein]-cysteine S-methyltransferase [Bacteroidia bacterium]